MPQILDFSLDETWDQNLARLKVHLEGMDVDCAKLLFDNLGILSADDGNARRDFNRKVLAALESLADAEIHEVDP